MFNGLSGLLQVQCTNRIQYDFLRTFWNTTIIKFPVIICFKNSLEHTDRKVLNQYIFQAFSGTHCS